MEVPVTSNIISASAGTGKTYKLASRFLALLALGYPAERLIALTFTRNAAGEFKGRILNDLAKGASSDAEAAKLTRRIDDTLRGAAPGDVALCPQVGEALALGREKYRELLRMLIRKLPVLNLSTLDSFFSKLVGSYCLELGYPSVVQLDDAELAKVRREAICSLLDCRAEDEEGLLELCQTLSEDTKKNILEVLEENVSRFYTLYQDTRGKEVWGRPELFGVTDARVLTVIHEHADDEAPALEAFLRRFVDEQELRIVDEAQSLKDDKRIYGHAVTDCNGVFTKLRRYLGWNGSKKGDLGIGKRLSPWLYGGQGADDADVAALMSELRFTRDVVIWLPQVRKTLGITRLLKKYDERYREDVRATGRLVFDDMPRLVADKLLNGEALGSPTNIAYRLDGRLDHWMLDEFQDTSPEQWAALKVLLYEVLSSVGDYKWANRSLFVVGDEKQSIYGWRGATPQLFTFLKKDPEWNRVLQLSCQDESYRSAPAIMGADGEEAGKRVGFVNALFEGIGRSSGKRELGGFTRHRVAQVNAGMPGYVRVETCTEPATNAPPAKEAMCQRMAEILNDEVHFAQGGLSAAILVRSNSDVSYICNWFRKNQKHLPVESLADENVGTASLLGEFFKHFFKWMLHPGDQFSRRMLGVPLSLLEDDTSLSLSCTLPQVVREGESEEHAWNRWRQMLEAEGYAAVIMKLTAAAAGAEAPARRDRAYREWLNAARSFDASGGTPEEWLLFISNLKTKANPPKSCIHVMTFHKSKGAEYDVVLLPFSSTKAAYRHAPFLKSVVYDRDRAEVQGVVLNPGIADKEAEHSPYRKLQRCNEEMLMEEAYHVLYVAVTRAKYANYILLNGYKSLGRKPQANSYSDIITSAIGGEAEWGDKEWHSSVERKMEEEQFSVPTLDKPRSRRRKVSPSKLDESSELSGEEAGFYEPAEEDAAEFGTAVHELFEQVVWLGEAGVPEPSWLCHPQSAEERLVAAALRVPSVQVLYTRKPGQEAYNEQNLDAIRQQGDEKVWISGTIDRLVLTLNDEGVPVEASVVDFKTDIRVGDTPEEQDSHLRRTHCAQMRTYHSLITEAFSLPAEAVSVTLISCPRSGESARPVPYATEELVS